MRNLFVCHTQAHLISSCGLSLGRFNDDQNDLILFTDFLLKDQLKNRIEKVFDRILVLQGIFPQELNTFWAKFKNYPINDRKMKEFVALPYNKVFTSCDTIYPEQKCMQIAYKLSSSTEFCWQEDGIMAYYQNVIIHGGLESNSLTKFVRKIYFKYIKGLGVFYDRNFEGFGGSKFNKNAYCLYPEAVREPYKTLRIIHKITDEEYRLGLESMYETCSLPIKAGDIILILDKIQTYVYPDKVKTFMSEYIKQSLSNGKRIFCKFHPRETERWDIFDGCIQLENTVGVENIYLSLSAISNQITVIGIKSTGLMSAKKLGFNTISLFDCCGEKNPELVKFFDLIGIY